MAGNKTYLDELNRIEGASRKLQDYANQLDRATQSQTVFAQTANKSQEDVRDLEIALESQQKALAKSIANYGSAADSSLLWKENVEKTTKALDKMNAKLMTFRGLDKFAKGVDIVGRNMLKLQTTILTLGFNYLVKGIKDVYDLQERWAKATGAFNMKLGALSSNLSGFRKTAMKWEGTIRGLTDGALGEGMQAAAEFGVAFEKMTSTTADGMKELERFGKIGLQLSRGFDLGAESSGKFLKTMRLMGVSSGEVTDSIGDLISGAKTAGVAINPFVKEFAEVRDSMVQFGPDSRKSFITAMAYAKNFGIQLKSFQKFFETFDKFDEAAQTSAKINTIFGTSINALSMLLEQDPAERFEQVRKELLAQGKTYQNMSRYERQFLSEQLHLSDEEVAAMLDQKNAAMSLEDFRAKKAKEDKKRQDVERQMQKQLAATAQTLYAFGVAWDRITVAVAKAIKPILEVFGLSQKGGKDFKSFGQVMEAVTKKVISFFETLGKSREFQAFMQEIAGDIKRLGSSVGDMLSPKNVMGAMKQIIPIVKDFYRFAKDAFTTMVNVGKTLLPIVAKLAEHWKAIMAIWLASKGANIGMGLISKASSMMGQGGSLSGMGSRMVSPFGGASEIAGKASMALGGAGLGMATGALTGNGGIGSAIGSAGLGALGMALGGPLGAAVGGAVGGWLGKHGEALVGRLFSKSHRETTAERNEKMHQEKMQNIEKKLQASREYTGQLEDASARIRELHDQKMQEDLQKNLDLAGQNRDKIRAANEQYDLQVASLTRLRSEWDKQTDKLMLEAKIKSGVTKAEIDKADAEIEAKKTQMDIDKNVRKGGKDYVDSIMRAGMATADLKKKQEDLASAQLNLAETENKIARAKLVRESNEADIAEALKTKSFRGIDFTGRSESDIARSVLSLKNINKEISDADFQAYTDIYGEKHAAGGIITRPQWGMLGEAGPEAVIPLRTMGRNARGHNPSKFGGAAARQALNFAGGGQGAQGGGNVNVSVAKVLLDGKLVGRAIVKGILEDGETS